MPRQIPLDAEPELGRGIRRRRQVAPRAVGVRHALLVRGGGLEEHVGKLGPRNTAEQHQGGGDEQPEEHPGDGAGAGVHEVGPDQGERGARHERDHEQVSRHEPERGMALGGDIHADEEPEPVAPHANHQGAEMPQQRVDGGRGGAGLGVAEDHGTGSDYEQDESVHGNQVGQAPAGIAELSRGEDVMGRRRDRDPDLLSTADLARAGGLLPLHVLEEVFRAFLVDHVEDRARHHQQEHDDHEGLHGRWWNRRRNLGERVVCQHGKWALFWVSGTGP